MYQDIKLSAYCSISDEKHPGDDNGWTPLHSAASTGHYDVCRVILDHVGYKNPRDNLGNTPLHAAALQGHVEVYELIFANVEDKNPSNNTGQTPKDFRWLFEYNSRNPPSNSHG